MFALFTEGRILAVVSVILLVVSAAGCYKYQLQTRDNIIDELKTKTLVQGVQVNNLHTEATVQKNASKNKVFEEVQKSKKKDVQDVSTTINDTDVNVTIGKHSITL